MRAPGAPRALARAPLVLVLAARGAVGGGFGLKDIGDAVKKAVPGDPSKALKDLEDLDTSKAVDTAKDAVRAASESLPTVSITAGVGAGTGDAVPETETTTTLPALPAQDKAEVVKKVVKDNPLGGLIKGVKDVTAGNVVETIKKAGSSALEDAASQVTEHGYRVVENGQKIAEALQDATVKDIGKVASDTAGTAVEDAVTQATGTLGDVVGALSNPDLADKAKTVNVQDAVGLANSDGVKRGAEMIKGSTLDDLGHSLRGTKPEDVKRAVANPQEAINQIVGKKLDAKDDVEEDSGTGTAVIAGLAVLGFIVVGGYLLFQHLTKPRSVAAPMLTGDPERDNIMMTTHWMGSSAREVIASSSGTNPGNSEGFTRF